MQQIELRQPALVSCRITLSMRSFESGHLTKKTNLASDGHRKVHRRRSGTYFADLLCGLEEFEKEPDEPYKVKAFPVSRASQTPPFSVIAKKHSWIRGCSRDSRWEPLVEISVEKVRYTLLISSVRCKRRSRVCTRGKAIQCNVCRV